MHVSSLIRCMLPSGQVMPAMSVVQWQVFVKRSYVFSGGHFIVSIALMMLLANISSWRIAIRLFLSLRNFCSSGVMYDLKFSSGGVGHSFGQRGAFL